MRIANGEGLQPDATDYHYSDMVLTTIEDYCFADFALDAGDDVILPEIFSAQLACAAAPRCGRLLPASR